MPYYLTIHHEPMLTRQEIESRWVVLAGEPRAFWIKAWFDLSMGRRFCWWDAPNRGTLEQIFADHGVRWEEIVKVNMTDPSQWILRED